MPTPAAQTFLEGAVKDLERLKTNADLIGGNLALLAYLLDMALWRRGGLSTRKASKPRPNDN